MRVHTLNIIHDCLYFTDNVQRVIKALDHYDPNWASATSTAADWDVISLMTDTNCRHPKWTPWPFDYTKETCAHCGEERRLIKGRAS